MDNIPVYYDYINTVNSQVSPSTVHARNTSLQRYFAKYLLQKAIARYKFTLPAEWDMDYFTYSLFGFGYVTIFDSGKFGVIPQHCTLAGRNVFYRPYRCIVTNPLMPDIHELIIDRDCALIKLQPDYCSVMDMVNFYADMMALCAETAGVNLVNSKLAYVFTAQNKTSAESFKKLYDEIASGNPAVVQDAKLLDEDGNPSWSTFSNSLKSNYIAGDIWEDLRKIEQRFLTLIGTPNANTEKKERLVVDEVNANNIETETLSSLWLDTIRRGFEKANEMYGLSLAVDFRFDDIETITEDTVEEDVE